MPPNSHPKNYYILIEYLMIFGRFLEPKWEARGDQKGARKGDKIEGKEETRSGSAQGTKMEPKWSQHGANMKQKWSQNVARMEPIGHKNYEILTDFFNSFY